MTKRPKRLQDFAAQGQQQIQQMARQPTPGAYARFEIGTTDAQAIETFYTQAFGWRFVVHDTSDGRPYTDIFTGNPWPSGRMHDHSATDLAVDYAMPCFLVTDLPATTDKAHQLGASVEFGPHTSPGGRVVARLSDPRGNRLGLFSSPTLKYGAQHP
jgi:predicted enzyme related to lactoylglutathione lyase